MEIHVKVKEILKKKVARAGSIGRVYVPKEWVGKEVWIILEDQEREK